MKIILYILGAIFIFCDKLSYHAKLYYKTFMINKNGSKAKFIGPETIIKNPNNIFIGEGTYINSGYIIAGKISKIKIGKNCLISYNVHLRTDKHNYLKKNTNIIEQGITEKDIIIDDDVWIGFGAQIMPGIKIEKGAVIGAGSVVTKNVPSHAVVAGNPARIIKYRL